MKILGLRIYWNNEPRDHRLWIWFGENNICFEVGKLRMFGFGLNVDTENITFDFHLWWSFYMSLDFRFIRKFLSAHPNYFFKKTWEGGKEGSYWEERSLDFHLNTDNWSISIVFWDNMNYEKKRHRYYIIPDILFGRPKYSEKILDSKEKENI